MQQNILSLELKHLKTKFGNYNFTILLHKQTDESVINNFCNTVSNNLY